ncbi:MAG: hypothetical protein QW719_00800 [Candidatus Micrarchaeaceae archaeon]
MVPEDYKRIAEKIMKGTTTVGIICSDGVVMGADSRATMDTFIASSEAIKIYKIDENIAMTIAGGVGDAEYLVKFLKMQNELYKMNEGKPLAPNSATSLFHIVLQESKMMPYFVQLIIGGIDDNGPELYSIDFFGGYTKESKFTSTGSGSLTALGYLEDAFKPENTVAMSVKIAAKALKIAMKRDSATGDHMKIVSITKDGYKEYSEEEIAKLLG